jgi:hypothetical protein
MRYMIGFARAVLEWVEYLKTPPDDVLEVL